MQNKGGSRYWAARSGGRASPAFHRCWPSQHSSRQPTSACQTNNWCPPRSTGCRSAARAAGLRHGSRGRDEPGRRGWRRGAVGRRTRFKQGPGCLHTVTRQINAMQRNAHAFPPPYPQQRLHPHRSRGSAWGLARAPHATPLPGLLQKNSRTSGGKGEGEGRGGSRGGEEGSGVSRGASQHRAAPRSTVRRCRPAARLCDPRLVSLSCVDVSCQVPRLRTADGPSGPGNARRHAGPAAAAGLSGPPPNPYSPAGLPERPLRSGSTAGPPAAGPPDASS